MLSERSLDQSIDGILGADFAIDTDDTGGTSFVAAWRRTDDNWVQVAPKNASGIAQQLCCHA